MENIKKYVYNTVVIVLIAVGAIVVILNFSHFGNVEFTDNARVRQHITPQNTRVQGFIKEVRFEEFQKVRRAIRSSSSKTLSSACVWLRLRLTWLVWRKARKPQARA